MVTGGGVGAVGTAINDLSPSAVKVGHNTIVWPVRVVPRAREILQTVTTDKSESK